MADLVVRPPESAKVVVLDDAYATVLGTLTVTIGTATAAVLGLQVTRAGAGFDLGSA